MSVLRTSNASRDKTGFHLGPLRKPNAQLNQAVADVQISMAIIASGV
jgi:hypothetical protein